MHAPYLISKGPKAVSCSPSSFFLKKSLVAKASHVASNEVHSDAPGRP